MFDFIINSIADIVDVFFDLWINKIIDRKGTQK